MSLIAVELPGFAVLLFFAFGLVGMFTDGLAEEGGFPWFGLLPIFVVVSAMYQCDWSGFLIGGVVVLAGVAYVVGLYLRATNSP